MCFFFFNALKCLCKRTKNTVWTLLGIRREDLEMFAIRQQWRFCFYCGRDSIVSVLTCTWQSLRLHTTVAKYNTEIDKTQREIQIIPTSVTLRWSNPPSPIQRGARELEPLSSAWDLVSHTNKGGGNLSFPVKQTTAHLIATCPGKTILVCFLIFVTNAGFFYLHTLYRLTHFKV